MAPSAKHRGWTLDHNYGILAAVYNGVLPGTAALGANTALANVLAGTPVMTAIPVDSLVISNTVANGDIVLATLRGGTNSAEAFRIDTSAALMVFNEASVDWDLRVETDNMQYAIYSDAGKDALVLGSNTDTSSADQLITISRAARTATANTSYYDLRLAPVGAVTVPAGTTAIVATASLVEPNITATGTVTRAATLHIASQPTEGGTANAAIYFGAAANIAATTSLTINDDSEDIDFRVETNGMAYAVYSDGGKDSIVLGSNTDTSSADQLVNITRAARTATAATNYYDLSINPAGAVTVPAGTTALVATLRVTEPNITATGTVTAAATVYVADAPTEGSSNYALWIDSGVLRLDGNLDLGDAAIDILVKAATAAALEISDGTTKFYAIDTRVATASVTTHTFNISAYTIASGATNVETGLSLAAHTLNYTGTTQVTTEVITASIGARTIAGDTATLTVDKASTLKLVAPIEGTNVTLTATSALRIGTATGSPTTQYGIFIESLSGGGTNRGIYLADANGIEFAAADDLIILANTAAALEVSDGTTKLLALDTRNTVTVQNTVFTAPASQTLPNGAASQFRHVSIAAHTVTLVGTTQVTTANVGAQLWVGAPTYNQSGGAVTVDQVSTLHLQKPVAGASVTITTNDIISTDQSGCHLTAAGVWTDTTSSRTIKQDIEPLDFEVMPNLLEGIRPVSFKYDPAKLGTSDMDRQHYGVIAEELPDFLRPPGEKSLIGLSGSMLGSFSLAGLRYLHETNKALMARVAGLESQLATLQS